MYVHGVRLVADGCIGVVASRSCPAKSGETKAKVKPDEEAPKPTPTSSTVVKPELTNPSSVADDKKKVENKNNNNDNNNTVVKQNAKSSLGQSWDEEMVTEQSKPWAQKLFQKEMGNRNLKIRLRKRDFIKWLRLHVLFQISGAIIILTGFALIVYEITNSNSDHFSIPHAQNGLCVVICVALTPFAGLKVKYFGRNSKWGTLHFLFYMFITVGGLVQWQLGLSLYDDTAVQSSLFVIGISFAVFTVLRKGYNWYGKKKMKKNYAV